MFDNEELKKENVQLKSKIAELKRDNDKKFDTYEKALASLRNDNQVVKEKLEETQNELIKTRFELSNSNVKNNELNEELKNVHNVRNDEMPEVL